MRIGILTHNYPKTSNDRQDAGTFVFELAKALRRKGHSVYVFSPNFFGTKEPYKDIPVTWYRWYGGEEKLGNMNMLNPKCIIQIISLILQGRKKVLTFASKNKIDVCLSMWALPSGLFALEAKKKLGIPFILLSLGSDALVYTKLLFVKGIVANISKNANAVLGNSTVICQYIRQISGKKARFVPSATSLSFSKITPAKLAGNTFNFLFVGRLEKVKGPDVLLEAVKILKGKINGLFRVYFAGHGSLTKKITNYAKQTKIESNIEFLGNISDKKKLARLFLAVDCLIIPSRSESLPVVLVEAIHAKLPMIATSVGDMEKVVKQNKIGIVVPKENPKLLSEAMQKMLERGKNFKFKNSSRFTSAQKLFRLENTVNIVLDEITKIQPN